MTELSKGWHFFVLVLVLVLDQMIQNCEPTLIAAREKNTDRT